MFLFKNFIENIHIFIMSTNMSGLFFVSLFLISCYLNNDICVNGKKSRYLASIVFKTEETNQPHGIKFDIYMILMSICNNFLLFNINGF